MLFPIPSIALGTGGVQPVSNSFLHNLLAPPYERLAANWPPRAIVNASSDQQPDQRTIMNARHLLAMSLTVILAIGCNDSGLEPDSNSDSPQLDKGYPEGGRDTS